MRRDNFDVGVRNETSDNDVPVVTVQYDGLAGELADRLTTDGGTLDAGEIDVTYRMTAGEGEDPRGVISVANRFTGDYVLEANLDPQAVFGLVDAVKGRDIEDETSYRLRLTDGEGKSTVYDKRTLLVYDADGSLLRQKSLIPGGVEL